MIEHLGYKWISDVMASSPSFISMAMVPDVPGFFRSWWNCWRTCTSGKVTNPYFLFSLIERSLASGRRMTVSCFSVHEFMPVFAPLRFMTPKDMGCYEPIEWGADFC